MDESVHYKEWTKEEKKRLAQATTFKELADIALGIMKRRGGNLEMVSGPISTGGVGTVDGNMKVFEQTIESLDKTGGVNVFSQMPFEPKMHELHNVWSKKNPGQEYCMPILEDFYEPVFSSGLVKTLNFIKGWESSKGARWEHEGCNRWNIRKVYL